MSGVIHSLTFTPSAGGKLTATASFTVGGSRNDFGSAVFATIRCTQNGTTTNGISMSGVPGNSSASDVIGSGASVFTVTGGSPVTIDLYGTVSGAASGSWKDITLSYTLLKK